MSASESTVTYEPVWLKHRANIVEAIRYDGTEHCRRAIAAWIISRGGQAKYRSTGELLVATPQAWHEIATGEWVVRGVTGEFYNPDDDVVSLNYDRVPGPDRGATLTRDQAAAIVVAADEILDRARRALREGENLEVGEYLATLVEHIHTLAASAEAMR